MRFKVFTLNTNTLQGHWWAQAWPIKIPIFTNARILFLFVSSNWIESHSPPLQDYLMMGFLIDNFLLGLVCFLRFCEKVERIKEKWVTHQQDPLQKLKLDLHNLQKLHSSAREEFFRKIVTQIFSLLYSHFSEVFFFSASF